MFSYFKNMHAFRLLLLMLTIMSGVFLVHSLIIRHKNGRSVLPRALWQAIQEGADVFAAHLTTQESLGLSLAVQYEISSDERNYERLGDIMESLLESAPNYITGMGMHLENPENASRNVIFRTLKPGGQSIATAPLKTTPRRMPDGVYDDDFGRKTGWSLMVETAASPGDRFSCTFSAHLTPPEQGLAFVKADISWIGDILTDLTRAGAVMPMCISPTLDALWLSENVLVCNQNFPETEDSPPVNKQLNAIRSSISASPDAPVPFIHTEIMGTGWHLVVSEPTAKRAAWSLWVLLIAGGGLLLEGVFAVTNGRLANKYQAYAATDGKPPSSTLKHLLFSYRLSVPHEARIESELKVARDIQFRLVPRQFPSFSDSHGFDLFSLLSPAKEVGGDFHDFFLIPKANRLVAAVGDVSGKGVPAALYMAVARTAFRSIAERAEHPGDLLTRLNDLLVRDYPSGLYVTIACISVNLSDGVCRYALAGHPPPLWYRADTKTVEPIDEPRETFLGLKPNITVPCGEIRLRRNDTLLLYTDGLPEARNASREEMGYSEIVKRFDEAAASPTCKLAVEYIRNAVLRHQGKGEQHDDITLTAFRYLGQENK